MLAALQALDATLAGDPVAPEHADLAELALILRDERPAPDPATAARLDARVHARFSAGPRPAGARPAPSGPPASSGRSARRRWWPAASVLAAGLAVVALGVVVVHSGSGGSSSSSGHAQALSAVKTSAGASAASSSGASAGGSAAAEPPSSGFAHGPATRVRGPAPTPRTGRGRDVTQSAQLALAADPGQIDGVAQQIYDVVAAERGFVTGSRVLSRASGPSSATFALRVPSARLSATLTRLSELRDARVLSRADASADVTGQVDADATRLADERALRRSLLRQLSDASTPVEVEHVQAELRADARAIAAAQGALAAQRSRVSDSAVSVSVRAPAARTAVHRRTGAGLTLHRGLRLAGRVLVVVLTVVLVALAVIVPVGLLVAAGAWSAAIRRRRQREAALDG